MKNIKTILSDIGIEIPEDKQAEFDKAFNANYKTVAELDKKDKLIEALKEKEEAANATLEKFKDIDPDKIKDEVESWKKKYEESENDHNKKIYERDFKDALEKALEGTKFTSNAAKSSVMTQILNSGIQLKDGKLIGFNDILADIKENDKAAFVDDEQQELEDKKVRFTGSMQNNDGKPNTVTKESILAIKDNAERRKAIADNPELFINS